MLKYMLMITALLGFAVTAQAADSQHKVYLPGEQYKVLSVPVPTDNPDKIEVREFFFYGCPHCYHTQPYVNKWLETKPADVNFVHNPVLFMRGADTMARAFYIAKDLGILDKTHNALFSAIHGVERNQPLFQEDNLAEWFTDYGVSEEKFKRLFASFTVQSQVNQAKATTRAAQIRGVPAFLVDGKYLVLRANLSGENATFDVIDFLINKVRQDRQAGK